jgi:hypothetical protein
MAIARINLEMALRQWGTEQKGLFIRTSCTLYVPELQGVKIEN